MVLRAAIRAWSSWRAICRELRSRRFDLAVDLRGDLREIALLLRPARARRTLSYDFAGGGPLLTDVASFTERKHKIDLMLDLAARAGAADVAPRFGIGVREAGRTEARRLLLRAGIEGAYVLVHPGTRVPLKRYAALEAAAAELAKGLPDGVALAWLAPDRADAFPGPRVDGAGLSVDGLVEIVREARLLLCHDSAPWHVAQAVGTPAAAIFGPSKPWATGLYPGRNGLAISLDLPCRDLCDEAVCRYGKVEKQCLAELAPAQVAGKARALLPVGVLR
ncbi:MAG: glycosyltransferase family 9 protein [Acidobacteriota bacterium]